MLGLVEIETQIERMCRSGRPFMQIERVIDAAPASDGQKAALWLLAWSHQEPRGSCAWPRKLLPPSADACA